MFINSIELENWKCFLNRTKFNFKNHELISMKNGFGKTSIFEAIMFIMWGQTPVGFNLNTVRNDYNLNCRIFIDFDVKNSNNENDNYTIERIFGNKNLSELKINGELVCESVRAITNYINNIMNFEIVNMLWTTSLTESNILKTDFFTNSLLKDVLKDPLTLLPFYKSKVFQLNKKINNFDDKNILDIDKIQKDLEDIKSKLKEKQNYNLDLAKSAKNAQDKLNNLSGLLKKAEENGTSIEDARYFLKIYRNLDRYKKDLEVEMDKKDTIYSKINKNELEKILEISESTGKCLICGGDFSKDHKENIENELKFAGRSQQKIDSLQKDINFIECNDLEIMNAIIDAENLNRTINKCKNYDEIIESYNEENNKNWDIFEKLQKQYSLAQKQQEELKHINTLKEKVVDYKEKINVIDKYIEDASDYYNNEIKQRASLYLSSINSRYQGIDVYEGVFQVIVQPEDISNPTLLLPVARLSKGEKTMCALSLLFAIHDLLVPELPLLFDETFSALDQENLEQVQRFLSNQKTQIFVITHDLKWNEF